MRRPCYGYGRSSRAETSTTTGDSTRKQRLAETTHHATQREGYRRLGCPHTGRISGSSGASTEKSRTQSISFRIIVQLAIRLVRSRAPPTWYWITSHVGQAVKLLPCLIFAVNMVWAPQDALLTASAKYLSRCTSESGIHLDLSDLAHLEVALWRWFPRDRVISSVITSISGRGGNIIFITGSDAE